MQKVLVQLLKNLLVWVFFMVYEGYGHEDFNWVKMMGMTMMTVGTCWYIHLDMTDLDNKSAWDQLSLKHDSQLQLSFSEFSHHSAEEKEKQAY